MSESKRTGRVAAPRAEHVDPDHYQGWDGALQGCENDARDMEAIAKAAGFDATTLLTKEVTADAAIAAIVGRGREARSGRPVLAHVLRPRLAGPRQERRRARRARRDVGALRPPTRRRRAVRPVVEVPTGRAHPRALRQLPQRHRGAATLDAVRARRARRRDDGPRAERDAHDAESSRRRGLRGQPEDLRRHPSTCPAGDKCVIGANVLLLSGCQDNQTSADGAKNGLFTQTLLEVWNDGKFKGGHKKFWKDIVEQMPPWQSPNWFTVGPTTPAFHRRKPFTI